VNPADSDAVLSKPHGAPSLTTRARLGSSVRPHPYTIVIALMLLVLGLGLLRLRQPMITFDESVSIRYAHESWLNLWHIVTRADPNMSLYHAALKIWTGIFGDSVFAVRSLSVIAAVLCVPVVYAIGLRLFGVAAGLLAGLLISTNVFFLHYAQEARSYALLTLLVSLSTYFFLVEVERPGRWSRVGYVASSVLAFYAHFFAIWVLLIHVGTLVATKRRAALSRSWLACYAVMTALAAPMVYVVLTRRAWGTIAWIEELGFGWDAVPATYAQLAGDSFLHLGVVVAVCMLALRRAADCGRLAFGLAFTAAWAFLPVLAAFALSEVGPAFLAKYLIISLPAMVLLAAGAIAWLRPVSVGLAAACVLVALSVPELLNSYGFR
jgi:mannosyltransferase